MNELITCEEQHVGSGDCLRRCGPMSCVLPSREVTTPATDFSSLIASSEISQSVQDGAR